MFLQERKLRLSTDLGCGHMMPPPPAQWHLIVILITTWAAAGDARH